jgi:hypothetical protein
MTKRRVRFEPALSSVTLIITAVTGLAMAQWDQRYWSSMSKPQVEKVIKNVEIGSDEFRKDFDRWLDRSNLDGTTKEERYNSRVKNFEKATDRLRSEFDRKDKWWETREHVQETLNAARPVGQMMNNRGFGRNLETQWRHLRKALNKLAVTYRLRPVA